MTNYNWKRVEGFAHRNLIEKNNLTTSAFNSEIREQIREFNRKFNQAMKIGLSNSALQMMEDESERITKAIIQQFEPKKKESSVSALSVLGFVGLLAGAVFGVRELTK